MIKPEETICAPATGTGGAISVIRVSGPQSLQICSLVFFKSGQPYRLDTLPGYTAVHGEIRDDEETIDDVIVTVFRAPHSYTGDDSAEISFHASQYISGKILSLLISNGARAARPGEFTQIAFMNGKMDLSQAEAVADLIASRTRAAHKVAIDQLRGGFSAEIKKLRAGLLHFASLIELELDFGEEDVEFADRSDLKMLLSGVMELTDRLASSFMAGNAVRNGIPVVIAGKPNSGKSTLLNTLLNEERAIVSDIPGTTRDTIEDTIVIGGLEYRFIDTAGLRETSDVIESMGISRTLEKVRQASVVLFIDDVTDEPELVNARIAGIRETAQQGLKLIILINKTDIATDSQLTRLRAGIKAHDDEPVLYISAKHKKGIDELREKLSDTAVRDRLDSNEVIITNLRHYEALQNVSQNLSRALEGLSSGLPEDLIAVDIRQAIHYLGEITGEITTDEILGNIFKNFCIGK